MRFLLLPLLLCVACFDGKIEDSPQDTEADTDTDADTDADADADADADVLLCSSGGGGSTVERLEWEYVEEDCPTDCSENTAPVLDSPLYLVNGAIQTTPPTTAGDAVAVLIAFSDAECNLACGTLVYSWGTPENNDASIGSMQSNLPCDTASSTVFLGFDMGDVAPGEYGFGLRVEDVCGESSNGVEGSFTIP